MPTTRITDRGPSDDLIEIVDEGGMTLMSYKSGSGKVDVHPSLKVGCVHCGREFLNNVLVGFCTCDMGRYACHTHGTTRVIPDERNGRPWCNIHKQVMWRAYDLGRWICDGCESLIEEDE